KVMAGDASSAGPRAAVRGAPGGGSLPTGSVFGAGNLPSGRWAGESGPRVSGFPRGATPVRVCRVDTGPSGDGQATGRGRVGNRRRRTPLHLGGRPGGMSSLFPTCRGGRRAPFLGTRGGLVASQQQVFQQPQQGRQAVVVLIAGRVELGDGQADDAVRPGRL